MRERTIYWGWCFVCLAGFWGWRNFDERWGRQSRTSVYICWSGRGFSGNFIVTHLQKCKLSCGFEFITFLFNIFVWHCLQSVLSCWEFILLFSWFIKILKARGPVMAGFQSRTKGFRGRTTLLWKWVRQRKTSGDHHCRGWCVIRSFIDTLFLKYSIFYVIDVLIFPCWGFILILWRIVLLHYTCSDYQDHVISKFLTDYG